VFTARSVLRYAKLDQSPVTVTKKIVKVNSCELLLSKAVS
jgi:hypothetical protein